MEEEINLFIRFLKREKALDSFMKMTEVKSLVNLRAFLSDCLPEDFIFASFTWALTIEGSEFWRDLYDKWRIYLRGKKK
jgi:hypothetical protein